MSEIATPGGEPKRVWRRFVVFGALAVVLGAVATFAMAETDAIGRRGDDAREARLRASLEKSLPNTKVTAVSCSRARAPRGLCEFVAGRNVFYATPDGRYVLLGQLLDLRTRSDVTARRTQELAALAEAEARIAGREPGAAVRPAQAGAVSPRPSGVLKVVLPAQNAVVHNPGGRLKLTVFSDYSCGYCRQLFSDLEARRDIEITEYPIAVLGPQSAARARQVLCAKDPAAAANALYRGDRVETPGDCPEGERRLKENMAFAQAHGISGTPMLVRVDGATNPGWMPAGDLVAWLNGVRG